MQLITITTHDWHHCNTHSKPNQAHKNNATIHDCACFNKESHSVKNLVLQVACVQILPMEVLGMYNTNRFRIETMYDYYIAMKIMFLVVKLSSHSSIGYASLTILLPWTTYKQHQNYSKPKAFQNQNFNSHKLCINTIILYKWRCFSRSQNTSLNTNQKEINQETS